MRGALTAAGLFVSSTLLASAANAAPALRTQVNQHGDFVLFGNSSAHECNSAQVTPLSGVPTCPGSSGQPANADSAPDIFWRADVPMAGNATATNTITPAQARTTAVLALPADAVVTHARLYWAALKASTGGADASVNLEPPAGGALVTVTADASDTEDASGGNIWYQSTADVTDAILANGSGAYRLSGIDSLDIRDLSNEETLVGWVIVVFYEDDAEPLRQLSLFDGLTLVASGSDSQTTIDGFLVPASSIDGKLGVIGYEGDAAVTGDSIEFNDTALFDVVNPVDDFFNSSRSLLATPFSSAGDLPRLTGEINSMGGLDFDVMDVTPQLLADATSATLLATTTGTDQFLLGAFVTSITTSAPSFAASTKSAEDVDGEPTLPGDEIEYTIVASNDGSDDSAETVVVDALPEGVSYVPGSLEITDGDNAGALTDDAGDDQGEYDAGSRTITVRLGAGADASDGGSIAAGETATLKFRVSVDVGAIGTIANQATISAAGDAGASAADYLTDGDDAASGTQTTDVEVLGCDADADCGPSAPRCDQAADPKVCVGCLSDADCTNDEAPNCLDTQACGCAAGEGQCAAGEGGAGGEAASGGTGGSAAAGGTAGSANAGTSFGGTTVVSLGGSTIEGGGCSCRTAGDSGRSLSALIALAGGIFALGRRRARRVSSRT